MTTPYADQFAEAQSTTIEVDGEQIHSIVEIPVDGPITFVVVLVRFRSDRPQGLVIDGDGVGLTVGELESPRVTLWTDTAPATVSVTISERRPVTLRLWNTWREDAVEHAWVGWAAMRREDDVGVTTLACRDGHADGDFNDLVVELAHGLDHDSGLLTTALQ